MQYRKSMILSIVLVVFLSLSIIPAASVRAQAPDEKKADEAAVKKQKDSREIQIGEWLVLGPVKTPFPAFHDTEKTDDDATFLLSFKDMDISSFTPVAGGRVDVFGGDMAWFKAPADSAGTLIDHSEDHPSTVYFATWVELPRWMEIELEASSTDPFEIFVDGRSVAKCTSGTGTGQLGEIKTGNASLKQGKYLIVAKSVHVPADTASEWRFNAYVKANEKFKEDPVVTLDPTIRMNISHVLDRPEVQGIDVSPDGSLVMISYRKFIPPGGERDSYMEIRSLPNGEMVRTIRESSMSGVEWAPTGRRLSYTVINDNKGSLRILDIDTGEIETVIEGVGGLGGYRWSPDASYIVFYATDEKYAAEMHKQEHLGVKRLLSVEDRQAHNRNRTSVFIASVPGGMVRKLATGKYDSFVGDIHPDGRKLLLRKYYEDLSERPFGKSEIVLLDLDDMSTELLYKGRWLGGAEWSPDGTKILVQAGPSTFGEIGRAVPEGVMPNEYDGQLYIFDPATKAVRPLTRDFDPSVDNFVWSKKDGKIYFSAEKGSRSRLFRCDPGSGRIKEFNTESDVLGDWDIARDKAVAVYESEGAVDAPAIYSLDLQKDKSRLIVEPGAKQLEHLKLGKLEDFDFVSDAGRKIIGRVHYPPDFDPEKLYPCIVYYYGGTSPVDRRFAGRYPLNLWAAKGYVVYCLQPSGATGFGQEFSSSHVNDWGIVTAGEIITGVKKFLEAHPFVNPYRVGCEGASFGGFMTQLLITKTDIFAAAVSHAGISMIGSYWGEGYWGYGYNAVSAAESYPWNRPDIYVDQSPLFAADKIVTPLLLTHGAVDTNVPPGESEQMYTALKILGKEVEYLKYEGQNHFILEYKKRIAWSDAQIAWFDKWLKGQPEMWDHMYPPVKAEKRMPEYMGRHIFDLNKDTKAILGKVTREDIIGVLDGWDAESFVYVPDEQVMEEIGELIYGVDITCVLGTWCSDSEREIPRLWKILEDLQYPLIEIEMYAVGSSRFSADLKVPARVLSWSDRLKQYYDVEKVATIIISRDGKELGRIEETPEESLEKHLLKILKEE